jgi:hypothetical protein
VSGKPTFRRNGSHAIKSGPHLSNRGGWVPARKIRDSEWRAMEGALGRALSAAERERVVDAIELHANIIRTVREARTPAQDVRATLLAMSRLDDTEILRAHEAADITTRALLEWRLLLHRRSSPNDAEALRAAAVAALAAGVRGAAKGNHYALLARTIAMLWRDMGGTGGATATGEYASPMTRFAEAIFAAAGAPISTRGIESRMARVGEEKPEA